LHALKPCILVNPSFAFIKVLEQNLPGRNF